MLAEITLAGALTLGLIAFVLGVIAGVYAVIFLGVSAIMLEDWRAERKRRKCLGLMLDEMREIRKMTMNPGEGE